MASRRKGGTPSPRGVLGNQLAIGHYDQEPASFVFGAPDLHAAAEQLDTLPDAQQAEPGFWPR